METIRTLTETMESTMELVGMMRSPLWVTTMMFDDTYGERTFNLSCTREHWVGGSQGGAIGGAEGGSSSGGFGGTVCLSIRCLRLVPQLASSDGVSLASDLSNFGEVGGLLSGTHLKDR